MQNYPYFNRIGELTVHDPHKRKFRQTYAAFPRFVVLAPDGKHLALDEGSVVRFFDSSGTLLHKQGKAHGGLVTARNDGAFVETQHVHWNGERGFTRFVVQFVHGTMYAFRCDEERFGVAFQNPAGGSGEFRFDETFSVQTAPLMLSSPLAIPVRVQSSVNGKAYSFYRRLTGVGAIAEDWHSVVALSDRRLIVLTTQRDEKAHAVPVTEVELPYVVNDLSIAAPYVVLVVSLEHGTRVICVDGKGELQWSVLLPFKTSQPPIDGGNGRIYIAGQRLVALQDGRIVWQDDAPVIHRATAFVDGSLAVTMGSEIRWVGRDGSIKQVHVAAEGEEFLTPPAIGADGSVWAATSQALYVAHVWNEERLPE